MKLYPKDVYEKLEFDKILGLLQQGVLGEKAARAIDNIEIATSKNEIELRLDQVLQCKKAMEDGQEVPLSHYESVAEDIPMLRKEGYVLSVEAIRRIYGHVSQAKALIEYFEPTKVLAYPLLHSIYQVIKVDPALLKEIDRVLDENGEVRPDASPELLKISKAIRSKERELDSLFTASVKKYGGLGYLAETNEGLRNGRRVLTVSAENKRKIGGIIHDESATGKTVYIEPAEVMQINNEIFNLHTEHKKEVYKVLRTLCNDIRPYADDLLIIEDVLVQLDVLRAKARLAGRMRASRPDVVGKPYFGYRVAYNPILLMKNDETNKKTIPFDLELNSPNRMLVLSGPNAGGKSVTMKSVGLLQLMCQWGLLIPVSENTKMGIFSKIYTDIGDQQSVEDDLSTYSSRLKNMKAFLDDADEDTLILIDEFGSGTDPKIGGAIAEAILRQLNFQKCHGVVTTHYSNLKYFAFKAKGVVNGSMEFDKAKLSPTYQLIVGKPGSSFAFEIAVKSGIEDKVLNYARHKTGKNEKAIDELLTNLQSEKKELLDRMETLLEKEDRLDNMIKAYNEMHKDLEFRRKKIKLKAKESQLIQTSDENRALEQAIREIKEAKNLEEAKALAKAQKEKRAKVQTEVADLYDDIYNSDTRVTKGEIKVGGYVRMRNSDQAGKLVSIKKNKAVIEMGFLQVTIPVAELVPASEPLIQKKRSVNTDMVDRGSRFEANIDIRGYSKSDAEYFLQDFLDKALLNNAMHLKVVHGHGSGVLRQLLLKKLKEYSDIRKVYHPDDEYGGEGVTLIEF